MRLLILELAGESVEKIKDGHYCDRGDDTNRICRKPRNSVDDVQILMDKKAIEMEFQTVLMVLDMIGNYRSVPAVCLDCKFDGRIQLMIRDSRSSIQTRLRTGGAGRHPHGFEDRQL